MSSLSALTRTSIDRSTQTVDSGTQTDGALGMTLSHKDGNQRISEEDERQEVEPEEVDYTKIDLGPFSNLNHSPDFDGTTVNDSPREHSTSEIQTTDSNSVMGDEDEEDDEEEEEEPVIFEAASAHTTVIAPNAIKARGGLVNIPKRPPPPPPLPPRNNARTTKAATVDQGSGRSPIASPAKEDFEEVDLHGVDRKSIKQPNGIVMEDLEKEEPETERVSLDEEVKKAFEDQHLEKIESSGAETIRRDIVEGKTEAVQEADVQKTEAEETEDFHSVPTTPT